MAASTRTKILAFLFTALAGVVGGIWAGEHDRALGSAEAGSAAAQKSAPAATGDRGQEFAAANLCVGCHSPIGGPALSGTLTGRWLSPNITPDRVSGIG